MNKRTDKYYIVFLDLPKDIISMISVVTKKFNSKTPHITIKYDEELIVDESELIKKINRFTSKILPFEITLGNLEINESSLGFNVHIPVTPKNKIVNITKSLSRIIEPYINPNSPEAFKSTRWEQSNEFYPHISIKGSDNRKEAEKIIKEAQVDYNGTSMKFIVKSMTLARWNKDKWKKVKSFGFEKNNFK